MSIRLFDHTAEDEYLSVLQQLYFEASSALDFWSIKDVVAALKVPGTKLFMFTEPSNGSGNGMLLAREVDGVCEIFYVFILPKLRGKGWAKSLILALFATVKNSAKEIFLEVKPSNIEAFKLYEKLGFRMVQRRPRYYSNGEDALIMKKSLTYSDEGSLK